MNTFKQSLYDSFFELVIKHPDEASIRYEDTTFSYREIQLRIQKLEHLIREYLIRHSISAEEQLQICYWGENHPIALVLPLVCSKLGLTYVPISPLYPKERAAEIVKSLNGYLFEQKDFEVSDSERSDLVAFANDSESRRDFSRPRQKYLFGFYTSGTTGLPKLALIPEAQVLANTWAAIRKQSLKRGDKILAGLSLCHSGGLGIQALPGLLSGARINLKPKLRPATLSDPDDDSNVVLLVPSYLQLLKLSRHGPNVNWRRFRMVGIGSAPFTSSLVDEILAAGTQVLNIYGLTEAGPMLFSKSLARGVAPSIGEPNADFEWKIEKTTDELLVRGQIAQAGYRVGKTVEHSQDSEGWFNTHDRFTIRQSQLYFLGRTSATFNIGGMTVHAEKVESAIEDLPNVRGCLLGFRNHAVFGEILVAYIETSGPQPNKRDLIRNLRQRHPELSRHEIPREIEFTEQIPRTEIGKKIRGQTL